MATTFRGWKKVAIISLFVLPTLISVFLISLYPILYNVFISFTNRNRFHYNPPTEGIFACTTEAQGTYCWQSPILKNYTDLFGPLVTPESLLSWLKIVILIAPLVITYLLIERVRKSNLSPPDTWWWWLVGMGGSVGIWYVLNLSNAIDQLMNTGDFFIVMFRTVLYVMACMPFFILTGGILALILNNDAIKGKGIFRTILILPWAVPNYITAKIWEFFFRDESGTINQLLSVFGIEGPAWLQQDLLAFVAVVIINIWLSYPFFMTIILGALQAIPRDQYEAADVDGATWWQKLTQITIPLLRPAVMPAIVLSSITTFQMFNTVWLVTQGGPIRGAGKPGATEFVMLYAYKAFRTDRYGATGAFAVVVFLLLFAATLVSMRMTQITKGAYE
ncbi:MAG: sugar ABC transporter permease [Anaerolineae bacterium]|nr:sugar ABC transporter permease [Anaerolineae bacterium]